MISQDQLNILNAAKKANPFWFQAVLRCAEIMVPRRLKYSGEKHPYFNFFDLARRTGLTVLQVFLFYINIKLSRLSIGAKDFEDESAADSLIDAANYCLLGLGALLANLTQETIAHWEEAAPDLVYRWPILCVDFDGVLNLYDGWKGYYEHFEPRPGAGEFIKSLSGMGYCVVIHTARPDVEFTKTWLREHGIEGWSDVTNLKPPAVAYIDDRAMCFEGDYAAVLKALPDFKAHWEREAA